MLFLVSPRMISIYMLDGACPADSKSSSVSMVTGHMSEFNISLGR